MIEIDEAVPYYICERPGICHENDEPCFEECHHTTSPFHAKNPNTRVIFEEFMNTFHVVVDENGRLICTEKEKKTNE